LGQLNFSEEFYNRNSEGSVELRPGQAKNVVVQEGRTTPGIQITTTKNINVNNFRAPAATGFINSPAGLYYAVRVPAAQVTAAAAAAGGRIVFHSASFGTNVVDASVPVVFAEAALAVGSVSGTTVSINLAEPLARVTNFLAQETDFAPFYLPDGHDLGRRVLEGIADGSITDLFLVLRAPTTTPFPGISNQPPLILLSTATPIVGMSYLSTDGVVWTRVPTVDFCFSLVLSEPY
jgi:hypothetical protein